jgi:hypothetical protein
MYILRSETIADRGSSKGMTSLQKRQTQRRLALWREGADGEMELTLKRGRSCGLLNSGVVHLNYWIITREWLDPDESLGAHQSGPQDEKAS